MLKDIRELIYIVIKAIKQYFKNKKNPPLSYQEYKKVTTYKKFDDPRRKNIYESVSLSEEQMAEIDKLYIDNYGEKIPYIWHKHFTAFTGKFAPDYIPETLYIPEFEYYMNMNINYATVLEDKNFLPSLAVGVGIKTPKTKLSCSKGFYYNEKTPLTKAEAISYISNIGKVFVKPSIDSSSGEGCFVVDFKNGIDVISSKSAEKIIDEIGSDFCMQEIIVCSESIRKIYPHGVNTFRVITYRWKNEICVVPVIMRIGQGGAVVDNAHAGGMFIAVDDNGNLHETAFTEFKTEYKSHPDTSIVFKGYEIKNFSKVIDCAKKIHANVPQVGSVNWDFTIDNTETPVLIEANVNGGSVWLSEMAHGCGPFGNKTPEILRWLKFMNNLTQKDRKNYMFGEMKD